MTRPRFEEDGQVSEEPSLGGNGRQGPCNDNGLINLPTELKMKQINPCLCSFFHLEKLGR